MNRIYFWLLCNMINIEKWLCYKLQCPSVYNRLEVLIAEYHRLAEAHEAQASIIAGWGIKPVGPKSLAN